MSFYDQNRPFGAPIGTPVGVPEAPPVDGLSWSDAAYYDADPQGEDFTRPPICAA